MFSCDVVVVLEYKPHEHNGFLSVPMTYHSCCDMLYVFIAQLDL